MIDYVLIGCDENPYYFDFWPIVSKVWKTKFNITPVLGLICDEDSELIEDKFGYIMKFKKIDHVNIELQTQIIRFYLTRCLKGSCLISDIDMMPLSLDYFLNPSLMLNEENIILYSSDNSECLEQKMYPMCYVLSFSDNFIKILDINENWIDFVNKLNSMNEKWYTDQKYLYKMVNQYDKVIHLKRGWSPFADRRIDRGNWRYNPDLLKDGYYIDSHLLRPYKENKEEINKLFNI